MFRKQPGGSSNTSRQQLPYWWPTHWKVPILRPILLPRERSSCELFASSTARAAHNIELWRGQFRRPHCAAILDDLCSVWADIRALWFWIFLDYQYGQADSSVCYRNSEVWLYTGVCGSCSNPPLNYTRVWKILQWLEKRTFSLLPTFLR